MSNNNIPAPAAVPAQQTLEGGKLQPEAKPNSAPREQAFHEPQPDKTEQQAGRPLAFCVILPTGGGKPFKITGNTSADFMPALKDSSLAWINFPVEDVNRDTEYIANSLGFSQALTTVLLSGRGD